MPQPWLGIGDPIEHRIGIVIKAFIAAEPALAAARIPVKIRGFRFDKMPRQAFRCPRSKLSFEARDKPVEHPICCRCDCDAGHDISPSNIRSHRRERSFDDGRRRGCHGRAKRAAKRRWGSRFSKKIGGTAGLAQPRRRPSYSAFPRRAPTPSGRRTLSIPTRKRPPRRDRRGGEQIPQSVGRVPDQRVGSRTGTSSLRATPTSWAIPTISISHLRKDAAISSVCSYPS